MASVKKDPLLILGGGLMGLSVAHRLAREGRSVEVLSRRRSEAAGFVAAGMLAPHAEGLSGDLLKLGRKSLERVKQWVHQIEIDSGISCGLRNCGIIVPFLSSSSRDDFSTVRYGECLDRCDLEREVFGIASHWEAGILFKQDSQIDNRRRLMRALERACVSLGVNFQEGVDVKEILEDQNGFKGVNICTAEGELKTLLARQAVLCSGAWSNNLLNVLPIEPVKGQMLSVQGPRDVLKRIIFGPGTYLVPREDGLIVVGATSERDAGFSEGLTPSGQKALQKGLKSLLPVASEWPPMERWWGFRPCTPDEAPILGLSPISGLWIATGHHRNGVLLAAITAEWITADILGHSFAPEDRRLMKSFCWDRFS